MSSDVVTTRMICLILISLFLHVKGAPVDAEVKQFPGFDGELPSKHYAGYVTVGNHSERHLYYYFATSERNPSEDPITFWVNGGPGCAGLDALIHLIGPFRTVPDSVYLKGQPKVKLDPYSWTKVSNILAVDSPAGVGYSYSDTTDDYITDDAKTVSDLYEFLIKWFSEYPEFLSNPLYLGGASYSGVVVPVLAQEIARGIESGRRPKINFKGYSLGNAGIDVDIESNAKVPFAHKMGLISDEQYEDLVRTCQGKYYGNSDPDCLRNLEVFQWHIQGINGDHVLCLPCHFTMGISMEDWEYDSRRMYESIHGRTQLGDYCHEYKLSAVRLFDTETSRQILHAMTAEVSGPWIRCIQHEIKYERVFLSLTPYHLNLTQKGYRAFMYNGDHDLVIPYTAMLGWIKTFNYSVIATYHPWFVDDQIAGYAVQYENNLLFATFRGAGHTVTEYMPREALVAYQRWIDGAESL